MVTQIKFSVQACGLNKIFGSCKTIKKIPGHSIICRILLYFLFFKEKLKEEHIILFCFIRWWPKDISWTEQRIYSFFTRWRWEEVVFSVPLNSFYYLIQDFNRPSSYSDIQYGWNWRGYRRRKFRNMLKSKN
jgi:hypothetical protein